MVQVKMKKKDATVYCNLLRHAETVAVKGWLMLCSMIRSSSWFANRIPFWHKSL